jgi:cytochrome c-type biogenesis protein
VRLRALAVLALLFGVLTQAAPAHADNGKVGEVAPPFVATALDGGAPVALADLRGKTVLLNKWSTWCRPCVKEMPDLERLYQRHVSRGLVVVGVSVDRPGMSGAVRNVATQRGTTYPMWLDPADTFTQTFHSTGVPESILLDRRGAVVMRWPGAIDVDDPSVDKAIASAVLAAGNYGAAGKDLPGPSSSLGLIALVSAFAAGLLSFLSPCVLPLVPSYVAFLAGAGGRDAERHSPQSGGANMTGTKLASAKITSRRRTMTRAVAFVSGFSAVFIALGASATLVGQFIRTDGIWLARIGGVALIAFGLVMAGAIRLNILQRDVRLVHQHADRLSRLGTVGSAGLGAAFAAGWTPCIGPVLAGILTLAAASSTTGNGIALLAAYSAGLAVPFLAAALAIDRFLLVATRTRKMMPWINRVSGGLLIVLGVLLATGSMTRLSAFFSQYLPTSLG